MKPFAFESPKTLPEVIALLESEQDSRCLIAGGSDLLGILKDEVAHYDSLISLADIDELHEMRQDDRGLHIGALVTLAQLEHEPRVQGSYRILAEAARSVATPEIRNQGTLGGNLCQRPRCLHYRSALTPCLKKGGTDCPALESPYQQYLSIMGGPQCFSVHASDLAPALMALQAQVKLVGSGGERQLPLDRFFTGPEQDIRRENVLMPDEVLTQVSLPAPVAGWQGTYLKARERTAGDFPLVSVAVGWTVNNGSIQQARVVLGGVAAVPWPSPAAAAVLEGQPPSADLASRAADAAFDAAQPLSHNAFKIDIGRALVARAIMAVAAL